jgi:hypothetical protein
MNTKPWHRHVEQVAPESLTDVARERFLTFHEWYSDLSRWLIFVGEENMGVGATSRRLKIWLSTVGANEMIEQAPEVLTRRLEKMPNFPSEWPTNFALQEVRDNLDRLDAQDILSINGDMTSDLIGDLLRQSRKSKKLADRLEKELEAARGEAEDF